MSNTASPTFQHLGGLRFFRCGRLPQELCDIIIDLVPLEDLSPCSLVCSTWLRRATPRLLHNFRWPPQSHEDKDDKEKLFTQFLDILEASPRLQGAIRTLWLGHPTPQRIDHNEHPALAHILEINVLAAIVDLCPRLDSITLSLCRILEGNTLFEDGHCGRIGNVSLLGCLMRTDSDTKGLVHALSLFCRIDVLQLGHFPSAWGLMTTPFPPSLEVIRIQTYGTRQAVGSSAMIIKHGCSL